MEKFVKTQVDTKLNNPSEITSTHCANKRKFVPYSDIKELCIFSLSYYRDDIELRSMKKIPMKMYVHSMCDWKIPSYTYEEKRKDRGCIAYYSVFPLLGQAHWVSATCRVTCACYICLLTCRCDVELSEETAKKV